LLTAPQSVVRIAKARAVRPVSLRVEGGLLGDPER
jgi:hypothetical protein